MTYFFKFNKNHKKKNSNNKINLKLPNLNVNNSLTTYDSTSRLIDDSSDAFRTKMDNKLNDEGQVTFIEIEYDDGNDDKGNNNNNDDRQL